MRAESIELAGNITAFWSLGAVVLGAAPEVPWRASTLNAGTARRASIGFRGSIVGSYNETGLVSPRDLPKVA
jgi:hypothetical protein